MTNFNEMFEAENKRMAEGYKTGSFFGFCNEKQYEIAVKHNCTCLCAGGVKIDWYMTRGAKREPVIRVQWWFPVYASRKVYKDGYYFYKKTWQCVEKNQKFPFTIEGLEAAAKFAESL